jgi:hypothetical protein
VTAHASGRLLFLAALLASACVGTTPALGTGARPAETFVIPSQLPNGRVELAIRHAYSLGSTVIVPIAIVATRGTITGPIEARVLASGINEGGAPAEVLVRTLAAAGVTSRAGQRQTTSVSWDGRNERGELVPADAYSLVLDFRLEDAGAVSTGRAGVTLQLNAP